MKDLNYSYKRMAFVLITIAYAFITNCDVEPIITNKNAVEILAGMCLLAPEKMGVEAMISRCLPEKGVESVSGARVTLYFDGKDYLLQYVGSGMYRNDSISIPYNTTCSFSVVTKNGQVIQDTCTTPGKVAILNISPGDTIYYERVWADSEYYTEKWPMISWQRTSRTAIYLCFYWHNIVSNSIATTDTAIAPPERKSWIGPPPHGKLPIYSNAKIVVCALDSNLYQFIDYKFYSEGNVVPVVFRGKDENENPMPYFDVSGQVNAENELILFGAYTFDSVDVVLAARDIYDVVDLMPFSTN